MGLSGRERPARGGYPAGGRSVSELPPPPPSVTVSSGDPLCERCGFRQFVFEEWGRKLCPRCHSAEGVERRLPGQRDTDARPPLTEAGYRMWLEHRLPRMAEELTALLPQDLRDAGMRIEFMAKPAGDEAVVPGLLDLVYRRGSSG